VSIFAPAFEGKRRWAGGKKKRKREFFERFTWYKM